ncbi:hypothetical protein GUJ93_ZPchr0015g6696 [Zizania palustris]|uniref:Uncharacterized protein n=1 Tax=Zizania palustris TaxID=103762 RepID=A0A8J5VSQ8_ZIZPA|nr:hypothetical protein GUJ93_ZPchr0015g6696 [Zizania palustris]
MFSSPLIITYHLRAMRPTVFTMDPHLPPAIPLSSDNPRGRSKGGSAPFVFVRRPFLVFLPVYDWSPTQMIKWGINRGTPMDSYYEVWLDWTDDVPKRKLKIKLELQ